MKKIICFIVVGLVVMFVTSCNDSKKTTSSVRSDSTIVDTIADSTIYGVCGDETSMHSLELITDQGDSLRFIINMDEQNVFGGLLEGDRLAVVAGIKEAGDNVAQTVINLTTLQGKWLSLDKNFEIQEGGVVKSNVKAENNPWTVWRVLNGKLLLNADTFHIVELGADSLYLENSKGIFTYKRQK